eukprot:CAMPEP_0204310784 /NCGR_PEP_ID=MMETSP0469-20131031/1942_1 /ASSEMBLY_ACC=CAM_ASM_000384 /TAXON_ID=2969 /ORGANISM="Oxyrrhis marina" /LENGTH=56 /DNA_ID=CAMNT_0051290629 /DNA_START=40 /DNA_END=211 /DNA_ORIENTATION=-
MKLRASSGPLAPSGQCWAKAATTTLKGGQQQQGRQRGCCSARSDGAIQQSGRKCTM